MKETQESCHLSAVEEHQKGIIGANDRQETVRQAKQASLIPKDDWCRRKFIRQQHISVHIRRCAVCVYTRTVEITIKTGAARKNYSPASSSPCICVFFSVKLPSSSGIFVTSIEKHPGYNEKIHPSHFCYKSEILIVNALSSSTHRVTLI